MYCSAQTEAKSLFVKVLTWVVLVARSKLTNMCADVGHSRAAVVPALVMLLSSWSKGWRPKPAPCPQHRNVGVSWTPKKDLRLSGKPVVLPVTFSLKFSLFSFTKC
jgi:hypothetical protein